MPVIEGGGECGLSNFRTLCIPCHQKETKCLHGRLAVERKKDRVVKKDEERPLFAMLNVERSEIEQVGLPDEAKKK